MYPPIGIAVALLTIGPAFGAVVSYEGNVFPETKGWERLLADTFGAERWLEDGFFVQFVDLPEGWPGPLGNAEFNRRPLADFAGEKTFFIEWRVETDAPSSILDSSGTPVALVGGGSAAANYHFTITDARVQVWRSNFLPILYVDIEPGVPHTYRLELCAEGVCGERDEYAWYIDNQLGDSGVGEGPYPNLDSRLIWGVRRTLFDSTTRWDYIRFGTIPEEGSGDYDSDALLGLDDFYFLHECLANGGPDVDAGPGCRFADYDFDTCVDLRDLAAFQVSFTGGN